VLSELEISAGSRLLALVGFNLGIELGQIVFVALWAALQYGLVRLQGYARWVVTGGSIVLMVAAVMLTIVRASS
jgi:HupE / UreJ protein